MTVVSDTKTIFQLAEETRNVYDAELTKLESAPAPFTYEQQRRIYKLYLRMKDQQDDMHGVSDAANDIRELDARYRHD